MDVIGVPARPTCPATSMAMDEDDGVHPRLADGVVTEIEVCTAEGSPVVASGLSLAGVTAVTDLDLDGLAEIVGPSDPDGRRTQLLSLVDGELRAVEGALPFGEPQPDGSISWVGLSRLPRQRRGATRSGELVAGRPTAGLSGR